MLTLAGAFNETAACRRYLLLGNGFSISLFPSCFTYASLFQEAKDAGLFASTPELEKSFKALGTTDFEFVMEALKAAHKLSAIYGHDGTVMAAHAEQLKQVLVEAIAGKHPSRPNDVTDDQYRNCRAFLAQFIGLDRGKTLAGKAFSLNYDLLLYWTVLHDLHDVDWSDEELTTSLDQRLHHDDGFRAPESSYDADYVAWDQFDAHGQCLTYLHGALHLYERGAELAKLCWERSGNKPLMDQIRSSLDQDRYPLFVSEGTSDVKLARINKSAYLSKALRRFSQCCETKNAAMFIIGHSLAANDDHVLNRVKDGKISKLYVSIFGDPDSSGNLGIRAKAESLAAARPTRDPMHVQFIDASTLHIWDH